MSKPGRSNTAPAKEEEEGTRARILNVGVREFSRFAAQFGAGKNDVPLAFRQMHGLMSTASSRDAKPWFSLISLIDEDGLDPASGSETASCRVAARPSSKPRGYRHRLA